MPNHQTVGNITYIVNERTGGHRYAGVRADDIDEREKRTVAMQMQHEARMRGLDDPALQMQPPPIPVIAIGEERRQHTRSIVRQHMLDAGIDNPDEYLIGDPPRSFGRADLPLDEPDEYTVWAPYPPRAAGKRLRIRWLAVLKWILIPLIIIAAWYFLIDLALQISPF